MKTALKLVSNEVFEILEQKNVDVKIVTDILDCFIRYIPSEKQDIIFAYEAGQEGSFSESINYYNETYKPEL